MTLSVALRIARREMRGNFKSFRIFLACLTLGIAAIAAVGTVRSGIEQGLADQGAVILGGDAEAAFTYRFAAPEERAWMDAAAETVSEIVDFRSMAVVTRDGDTHRGLTQVKAVDGAYPLYGTVELQPDMPIAQALATQNGLPGAIMHRLLVDRLGLSVGDQFQLGTQAFRLTAVLTREPDAAAQGFGLGPRTIVRTEDLARSGLIGPGTLFDSHYRMKLAPETALADLKQEANTLFRDKGLRWRDKRRGAPGAEMFIERMGSFLVLVGLAGLAVGGIGVSAAVRSYLERKVPVIATLKTLGAGRRMIFLIYFIQIGVMSALGIALGLVLGALIPLALAPVLAAELPLPAEITVQAAPLVEAGIYGLLTAALFTLLPIARAEKIRPAALFRDDVAGRQSWPAPRYLVIAAGLLALLVIAAVRYAAVPTLALWTFGSIAAALIALLGVAWITRKVAARLAASRLVKGRTALRLALAAVGGPASEAAPVILSLGLGLSVLAAIGQIDSNLRGAISDQLPDVAPSFFFVDIQNAQLDGFLNRTRGDAGVSRVDTAPMLRGIITRINDRPAKEVAGDHWVISGDRGITYSTEMPKNTVLTEGSWWPADYSGPPLISFAAEEAAELGLTLGDSLTINILGRDITAEITSFRVVDFSTAGIGFVIAMNPGALAGAPHTHIATVYAETEAEAAILNDLGNDYPNITAISVREAIAQVSGTLKKLAAATSYGAGATLLTGFMVLIGAAAAGEQSRRYEAAILKTLGATRASILLSFALRAGIMGAMAGLLAVLAGGLAGWSIMYFVMEASFRFEPLSALGVVLGGGVITVLAGLFFALRPLATPPARVLRARE